MTSPQDPFSTPPAGSTPPPSTAPSGGYGAGPAYGSDPAPGQGSGWGSDGDHGAQGHRNGLGTAALVLGIIGVLTSWLVIGALLGLVAIVLGAIALGRVKRREASNRGSAIAGIVLGVLSLLLLGGLFAAGAALFNSDAGKGLVSCLEQAGQDQAAQQRCQQEFQQSQG